MLFNQPLADPARTYIEYPSYLPYDRPTRTQGEPRLIREPLHPISRRPVTRPWNVLTQPPRPRPLNIRTPVPEPAVLAAAVAPTPPQRPEASKSGKKPGPAPSAPKLKLPVLPTLPTGPQSAVLRLPEEQDKEGEEEASDWVDSDEDGELPPGFKARKPSATPAVPSGGAGPSAPKATKPREKRPPAAAAAAPGPRPPRPPVRNSTKSLHLKWNDWINMGLHGIFLAAVGNTPLHKVLPEAIHQAMECPEVTIEDVTAHLHEHRQRLASGPDFGIGNDGRRNRTQMHWGKDELDSSGEDEPYPVYVVDAPVPEPPRPKPRPAPKPASAPRPPKPAPAPKVPAEPPLTYRPEVDLSEPLSDREVRLLAGIAGHVRGTAPWTDVQTAMTLAVPGLPTLDSHTVVANRQARNALINRGFAVAVKGRTSALSTARAVEELATQKKKIYMRLTQGGLDYLQQHVPAAFISAETFNAVGNTLQAKGKKRAGAELEEREGGAGAGAGADPTATAEIAPKPVVQTVAAPRDPLGTSNASAPTTAAASAALGSPELAQLVFAVRVKLSRGERLGEQDGMILLQGAASQDELIRTLASDAIHHIQVSAARAANAARAAAKLEGAVPTHAPVPAPQVVVPEPSPRGIKRSREPSPAAAAEAPPKSLSVEVPPPKSRSVEEDETTSLEEDRSSDSEGKDDDDNEENEKEYSPSSSSSEEEDEWAPRSMAKKRAGAKRRRTTTKAPAMGSRPPAPRAPKALPSPSPVGPSPAAPVGVALPPGAAVRATRSELRQQELKEALLLALLNAPSATSRQFQMKWKEAADLVPTVYMREKEDVRAHAVAQGLVEDVPNVRGSVRLTKAGVREAARIAQKMGAAVDPALLVLGWESGEGSGRILRPVCDYIHVAHDLLYHFVNIAFHYSGEVDV